MVRHYASLQRTDFDIEKPLNRRGVEIGKREKLPDHLQRPAYWSRA
jgi:hypothetical protein